MMRKADRISGTFCLLFSVFIAVESYRLGLGEIRSPGPGFLFFWGAVVLGLLSLAVLARTWIERERPDRDADIFPGKKLTKVLFVLAALFLYASFLETLGYFLVNLLLFFAVFGAIERRSWPYTLIVSIAVTAAAHLIFPVALKVQLPEGLLGLLRF
ncbi:MAG: tripartite tricarboxylate transporter TctB family protein [Deltaproteobacteria bacterium]|nr:tripartite tricarboxylate transporter TctB family protein [Deltaproteobacteria bacterium]